MAFLLPIASKIVMDAVSKIPENEELGEMMINVCVAILRKAVAMTKTEMDDVLLEQVVAAIQTKELHKYLND